MEQQPSHPTCTPGKKKSFSEKPAHGIFTPDTPFRAESAPGEQADQPHHTPPHTAGMNEESRENELWERIISDTHLVQGVGAYGLEQCLSKMRLKQDTGAKLILEYPPSVPPMWVEVNYIEYIVSAAAQVLQGAREVELVPMEEESAPAQAPQAAEPTALQQPLLFSEQVEQLPPPPAPARKRSSRSKLPSFNSGLNADYSFDNFIVGDNCSFAYTAAQTLVSNLAQAYNPLFIHGASGIGKTHLLQAIGNAIHAQDDSVRVLYVTGETFMNHYIEAVMLKGNALTNFRAKYRKADVLLIDDVQFLADKAKDKTKDEFFHTFNALFSGGKQIVLCADCPPTMLNKLDSRLCSRVEQGLSVELHAPTYETRMDILRSKITRWKDALISDEVLDFLARNITRSVRRLEGALTRLAAVSSISARRPTLAEARQQVRDFLCDDTNKLISIRDIQQCVADEFQLRVADLNGRRRIASLVHPRQIAMFIARRHTACSLQDIGAAFGGRNHGTVLHAERTIEQKMDSNPQLRTTIERMLATLGA